MSENTKETLIVQMAELLMGNSVESNVIEHALKILCDEFNFDGGYVYEIDQSNCFHMKEQFSLKNTDCLNTSPLQLTEKYLDYADRDINFFRRSDGLEATDKLLDRCNAEELTAIFLTDERHKVCGFIAFSNLEANRILEESEMKTLKVSMHMLGKYIKIRLYNNKLSFAQNTLENILDNAGIDIYVNDFYTHEILYANKSMAEPYGGKTNFHKHKCWEVLFPGQSGQCDFCPQTKLIDETGAPTKVYSWNYQRAFDGEWFRVFSAAFRWVDGRLAHVVSSANISENKRNEDLIQYMANYDDLTKLPNRRMLIENFEKRIGNNSGKIYILFFDIDGFKNINDQFGHDAGDEFLVQLGNFFNSIPLLNDNIFRNGGDEFAAILDEQINQLDIINLIGFIHDRFKKPWQLKTVEVFCNTSVGVACYPEDGQTPEALLNIADRAMYHVKKSGGGKICFSNELKESKLN